MKGIIILKSNYTYEGDILNTNPHGKGIFTFSNGDIYKGDCKYGKLDGFGIYRYNSGGTYTGFFSYGKSHGIGTYEDKKNIYKGTWRCDKKHGTFYRTRKKDYTTYIETWIKNKLYKTKEIQYIVPENLQTTKKNPFNKKNKKRILYKGNNRQCIGCENNSINSTNDKCGHVSMCYECLHKCKKCPICRCPIGKIIKLYIS